MKLGRQVYLLKPDLAVVVYQFHTFSDGIFEANNVIVGIGVTYNAHILLPNFNVHSFVWKSECLPSYPPPPSKI
jgi:hypothetical protein